MTRRKQSSKRKMQAEYGILQHKMRSGDCENQSGLGCVRIIACVRCDVAGQSSETPCWTPSLETYQKDVLVQYYNNYHGTIFSL